MFCSLKCKGENQQNKVDFSTAKILYESGLTQAEVGLRCNTTQRVIHNLFRRNKYISRIPVNSLRGADTSSWKGDEAGYSSLHERVDNQRGKPKECSVCGEVGKDKRYEWANLTGNYTDVMDYQRMCKLCHSNYDKNRPNSRGKYYKR